MTGRKVPFRFRGRELFFALSGELFSSAGVDTGSALLLKVFSRFLDGAAREKAYLPHRVLDAGCGAGVLGVCAASALGELVPPGEGFHVRCQDRDALAAAFTRYNAERNAVPAERLSVHTEPLLWGPPEARYDLVLTNIPAKAGKAVLRDFVRRSLSFLAPGGRVMMVAVNPLADFFRRCFEEAGAAVSPEEAAAGHTVFVYGKTEGPQTQRCPPPGVSGLAAAFPLPADFLERRPEYVRGEGEFFIGDTGYRLQTAEGAPGFDSPGGAVFAAAKLTEKFSGVLLPRARQGPLLFYGNDPGHYPAWLAAYLTARGERVSGDALFAGRNVLALLACRRNGLAQSDVLQGGAVPEIAALPGVYPGAFTDRGRAPFAFAAFFPAEAGDKWMENFWRGAGEIIAADGVFVTALASTLAARLDNKKPASFTRAGDLKREGFRALAYRKK